MFSRALFLGFVSGLTLFEIGILHAAPKYPPIKGDTHRPTFFEPEKNAVRIGKPFYYWNFKNSKSLYIGPNRFSQADFKFAFTTIGVSHHVSSNYQFSHLVSFDWPNGLLYGGTLRLETSRGKVIWEKIVDEKSRQKWSKIRESIRKNEVPEEIRAWNINARTSFTVLKEKIPDWSWGMLLKEFWSPPSRNQKYRFCMDTKTKVSKVLVCSPYFVVDRYGRSQRLRFRRRNKDGVIVKVNNKPAPAEGRQLLDENRISFKAHFDSGMKIEVNRFSKEGAVIEEIALDEVKKKIIITGRDLKPFNAKWNINGPPPYDWWQLIYFDETYGQPRYYWELEADPDAKSIVLSETGADAYVFPLAYKSLPPFEARLYMKEEKKSTYVNYPTLHGWRKPGVRLYVDLPDEVDFPADEYFKWEYRAPIKGDYNRRYLNLQYDGRVYQAAHDVYRSTAFEVSALLQAIATQAATFSLFAEFQAAYWAEDLFGWDSYYLSGQRWGVGGRIFRSLVPFRVSQDDDTEFSIVTRNLDVRYRFTPGLWDRKETFGIKIDYQDIQFNDSQAKMIGVGAFWMRSLPKIFDEIVNIIPWFRKPKFVDMDFIYYIPDGIYDFDSRSTLNSSLALNFHGKIIFSPTFYAELGFGLKQYDFIDLVTRQQIAFGLAYAKSGIGISF